MKAFEQRLKKYKKYDDYFIVDVYKGGDEPWDTKRDLTWSEAKTVYNKAKKNDRVSRVEIWVFDWDQEDEETGERSEDYCENFFCLVETLEKEPYAYRIDLPTFEMTPIKWRC